MTKRPRKTTINMALKVAIVRSGVTQRRIAIDYNIGEVRLSQIVNQRGVPPTVDEKRSLSKAVGRPVSALFAADETAAAS